jgi:integrase
MQPDADLLHPLPQRIQHGLGPGLGRPGAAPGGLFACLYYAALRPSEAVVLREADLHLPKKGWGRIVLAASASRAGTAWTDHGTARQERGLKHRADNETRTIPIPPELVRLLRAHIKRYGTTPDGRIFQAARGGILQDSGYNEVWTEARKQALTPARYRSPLGRRPYDLRHAAVPLWLNSGCPPPRSPAAPGTASPSCLEAPVARRVIVNILYLPPLLVLCRAVAQTIRTKRHRNTGDLAA